MENVNHSNIGKIKLWSILGPFMALLIFWVCLVKHTPLYLYLSLTSLAGIVLCWNWKMKGLAVSFAILAGLLLATFSSVPPAERFWYFGLALTSAFSFVVTALCYEEIEMLLTQESKESKKYHSRIAHLGSKLGALEKEWAEEKAALIADLDWTKESLAESKEEAISLRQKLKGEQQAGEELKEKLFRSEKENEALSQEIEKQKKQMPSSRAVEKFQLKTWSSAEGSSDSYEPLYRQLRQQFNEKGKILDDTRRELFKTKENLALLKKELEEKSTYEQDDCTLKLEKDFIALSQELDRLDTLYSEEVAELHSLVGTLLESN